MIDPNVGKATQFSSTNQPPPEKKRVKKYKLKLKEYFNNNLPIIEEQMKKGNFQFWQACKEWVYGKETDKVEITDKSNLSDEELDRLIEEKLRLIQEKKNSNS